MHGATRYYVYVCSNMTCGLLWFVAYGVILMKFPSNFCFPLLDEISHTCVQDGYFITRIKYNGEPRCEIVQCYVVISVACYSHETKLVAFGKKLCNDVQNCV